MEIVTIYLNHRIKLCVKVCVISQKKNRIQVDFWLHVL